MDLETYSVTGALQSLIGLDFVVEFLDHVENGSEPARVRVLGRLTAVTEDSLTLRAWECSTGEHHEWCIVRSTIQKMRHLFEFEMQDSPHGENGDDNEK